MLVLRVLPKENNVVFVSARKPTKPVMTASEKNTSIDTNMPFTSDANISMKPFTAGTSFVQASEDLSTVVASTSNGSDLNNCSKLALEVGDDASVVTPAVSVDGGNLSVEKSITIVASFNPNAQASVSPCDNDSEGEKHYTRFSIASIMNERKDSTEDELESKKLVRSTCSKPKDESIESNKPPKDSREDELESKKLVRSTCSKPKDESIESNKPPKDSTEDELESKKLVRSTCSKPKDETIESNKLPVHTGRILTSEPDRQFNDYAFCDKSSEVKHPQTPLNSVPVQSRSPQLPEPAFVYPVQEESMSESMAIDGYRVSLPHTTSQNNSEINTDNHSAKEKNAYRFRRRDERHLDSSSGTTGRCSAPKKVSKTNISRATRKKLAVSENKFTVLNIPNVLQKGPPTKRRKLSKIDIAVLRRRERAQRRRLLKESERRIGCCRTADDYEEDPGSCDSDSEDEKEVDLLVKSGPACKLDLDSRKLEFLEIFKLTTHIGQNSIELQKMVKRKWIIPDVVQEEENTEIHCLNLPVPSISLSDKIENHDQKTNFLQSIGLETVATEVKQEMEEIWTEVVKERVRRKCDSSLTKYYQKVFKATNEKHNSRKCFGNEVSLALPVVHQYEHQTKERASEMLVRFPDMQSLSGAHIEDKATISSELSRELNKNRLVLPNLDNLNTNYILNSSKLRKMQEFKTLTFELDEKAIGPITSISPRFEGTDKTYPYIIQRDCHQNTSMSHLVQSENVHLLKNHLMMLPSKNIESNQFPVVENNGVNSRSFDNGLNPMGVTSEPSVSWPGLAEIKEAYNRYSKEKSREMIELKKQGVVLAGETSMKQGEVKFLERKQRNIYTTLSRIDKEKKELLRAIDQLTHFINYFR